MIHRLATTSALLACLVGVSAEASAATRPVTFTIRTDAASSYVWRGMQLNDDVVFQPTLELKVAGWTISGTGSYDLDSDDNKFVGDIQRTDYHVGYAHEFGRVTVGGGVYHYEYPGAALEDTSEVAATVSVRYPVYFGVSLFHDLDATRGEYAMGWVGHRFPLGRSTALDLRGSLGWGDEDNNLRYFGMDRNAVSDFETRLSVDHSFNEMISIHGYGAYSVMVEDRLRNTLMDGDHLRAGFGADFRF